MTFVVGVIVIVLVIVDVVLWFVFEEWR